MIESKAHRTGNKKHKKANDNGQKSVTTEKWSKNILKIKNLSRTKIKNQNLKQNI